MKYRDIHILGYPTNKASSGGFSANTPLAFEKVIHPHIGGKYGVGEKFDMIKVIDKDSPRKNDINNFDSVYQSVLNLCLEQIRIMWKGGVPITIGGDHAQGFPTVKASLFVAVMKELISGRTKSLSEMSRLKITALIKKNDFVSAAKLLENSIKENRDLKYKVENIISTIHIIWVDAHGDFNTRNISDSGNFHGMSLAAACGLDAGGIEDMLCKYIRADPRNVHIMCARDLDEREERLMNRFGVDFERFEMHDTDKGKIRAKGQKNSKAKTFDKVFLELVKEIKTKGGKIILSTDIDHLPLPETGTPLGTKEHERKNRYGKSPEGPSPEDTYEAFENVAHDPAFISFDITEVALGYTHDKTGKFVFGLKACVAGVNILASMLGGKKARKDILTSIRKQGKFREKLKAIATA